RCLGMLQQACARVESPISRRVCAGAAAARITPRIAALRAVSKHFTYSERQFTSSTGASNNPEARPPFPPYTFETATEKVRKAQDAWNTRNPDVVALAYTPDSNWRNRDEFF
ncbi:response regulator receiver domain-containing protein, partial [Nannochloropsis gaditana CCMP526]|uniref:response regulator receiver domain-containing protein n=1 Tax=Nannochloropsis gaditana (strain CCMP526) TaxID=1093141 RepID=UPI00029F5FF9